MWFAINDLDFVLEPTNNFIDSKNKTEIYILNIGLDIINSQTEKYNLINLLKERKIINNYDWFISFEVLDGNKDKIYNLDDILKTKPKLIIGCLPHDYYPKLYFKQNLISDYSFYLNFKDIYLRNFLEGKYPINYICFHFFYRTFQNKMEYII